MEHGENLARSATLDPKVRKFLDQRSRDCVASPHDQDYPQARRAFEDLQAGALEQAPAIIEDIVVRTDVHGDIGLRIVRSPDAPDPAPIVLYLHGGAWVAGNPSAYDRLLRNIAVEAEATVVFVDFTLAPEANYLTQIEQSYAALAWVVRQGERLGLDGTRVAIVGDCSGGNMAAVLTLMAKQRRFPDIALQILLYPIVDIHAETGNGSSSNLVTTWFSSEALKSRLACVFPDQTSWQGSVALPNEATAIQLNDLPQALVVVAEHDVARDGAEQYARQLVEAGVVVTCTRYNGVIHDFMLLNALSESAPARSAWNQVVNALRTALGERLR
ncbi:alpha/beta hydrolase [Rhizobium leguminosarum]|uniref:alpha/beta hydrolase n=1 Tax=Rhizobium leguminosarum TaxID=384 RepID=UPI003F9C1A1C